MVATDARAKEAATPPKEITMMYWGNGMGGWGILVMTVSNLLFWGLLIVGVVALVRTLGRGGSTNPATAQRSTAEEVLAERFARGEIDVQEYQERLQVLRGA